MTKRVNFKQISVHEGPEESPGYLLWRVSTQWRSAIETVLKPLNLTHPQFVVLATTGWLTRNDGMVSQVEIGKISGLDPNTTSQILRGLQAKKLIKRQQTVDARSKQPVLTTLGRERLSEAMPAVERTDAQFFERLELAEVGGFIKNLQKLMGMSS